MVHLDLSEFSQLNERERERERAVRKRARWPDHPSPSSVTLSLSLFCPSLSSCCLSLSLLPLKGQTVCLCVRHRYIFLSIHTCAGVHAIHSRYSKHVWKKMFVQIKDQHYQWAHFLLPSSLLFPPPPPPRDPCTGSMYGPCFSP